TNFPTTPFLRSISVTVSTRSVAVAPSATFPVSRNPTTWGMSIETGWPSIAASASMPPTPQPSTPRPLIIVVCESVPARVSGDAGEVLHQHARRHEPDLVIRELRRIPARQPLDLLGPHGASVLPAQQVLEQDFEGIRQAADREPALLQRVQAEDLEAPSSHCEAGPRTETVGRRHSTAFTSTTKYWVSPKQLVGMPMCCWYVSATRFPIDW